MFSGARPSVRLCVGPELARCVHNCKAAAVAKEVIAIIPGNRTSLSIEKFLEAPFAGKHPKLIKKGR